MNANNPINALELNHDNVVHYDVNSVAHFDSNAVVNYGQRNLPLNRIASLDQLMAQTSFIRAFKEART